MIYRMLIILFLICCNWSLAQESDSLWNIKGKVLLQSSHEPQEYCNVFLKNTPMGVDTYIDGTFEFKNLNLPEYILVYSIVGYTTQDTLIKKSDTVHEYVLYLSTDCYYSEKQALKDIEDKQPKLLMAGGIAPVVYSEDEDFENKYGVKYYDFGCTPPPKECMEEYNETIFKYLDKKYGSRWRKEVRKDVFELLESIYMDTGWVSQGEK